MIVSRLLAAAAFVTATAVGVPAFAQIAPAPAPAASGAPHARHHGSPFIRALRGLDLSDAQKSQIRTLMQNARSANQNADQATKRANAAKLRTDIENVLTPDQRTKLQQSLANQRQGNGAPPTRP